MKILYHHRTQLDDAQGIHITEMINALRELGHEVEMFSLVKAEPGLEKKEKGRFWGVITPFTPKIIYELMELAYNLYGYWGLRKAVRRFKPDFIYERYAMFTFCGVVAARRSGVSIVLEVNAPLYREKQKYDKVVLGTLSRFLENFVCNRATKTITVTQVLKDILVEQGAKENNIVVIPNGINGKEFHGDIDSTPIRKRYAIAPESRIVGVVGWFREWHGLDLLIQTCADNDLYKKHNVCLFFVGDGPAVAPGRELAKSLGVVDHVVFTGAIGRKEIPEHCAVLDIALQPRVTDYACPMKIVEYMALGKAIIAPDQPNIRELITHNKNGLLFTPENRDSLIVQLTTVIENPHLVKSLGAAARQSVTDNGYFWINNAQRAIDLV